MPESINIAAARCARDNNVTVILDMGGRDEPISDELISLCDIISPNETEVSRLFASLLRVEVEEEEEYKMERRISYHELDQTVAESKLKQFLGHQKPGFRLLMKEGSQGSSLYWLNGEGE